MYFVPLLLAIAVLLAYPSMLLAAGLGLLAWIYLAHGGRKVSKNEAVEIRSHIAYRVLSVKLLAISGEFDETTYEMHALMTSDFSENAALRGTLRDCAGWRADGWEHSARVLASLYHNQPDQLSVRLHRLIAQVMVQPGGNAEATQSRIVDVAKVWKLGPKHVRGLFSEQGVEMTPAVLAWR
jgi:hypothetical protein